MVAGGERQTAATRAGCGLGIDADWSVAAGAALAQALAPLQGDAPDLVLIFASATYRDSYSEMLQLVAERSRATEVAGCSASAVIAGDRELEDRAGIAMLALRLPPGSLLAVRHVTPDQVTGSDLAGMPAPLCHGIMLLADPYTTDLEALVARLQDDYAQAPILGGMATGLPGTHWTSVFNGHDVADDGATLIAFGGAIGLRPLVSQGCEPIGEPWTITETNEHIVRTIGGRPAYQVLAETIQRLPADQRERVNGNLLVGLAMNEYRDEFRRGDFLIRNLMGVDPRSGAIAIGARPRVGQTLQFQIRDARAADEQLRHMLGAVSDTAAAGVLFACNGRGIGLFGAADHDARTVRDVLGPLPLAGLFCNGEIGPVGAATYIHGFTASLALIEPMS